MDFSCVKKVLKSQPSYRLKQAKRLVFFNLIDNWNQATSFSPLLREELNKKCSLEVKAKTFVSKNKKTTKILIELSDGLKIESVLMKHKDKRNTVCVSSQVGCALDCVFCATGRMGFKRNLKTHEIVNQVLFFARYLKKKKEKITNIVFMGMGEPFLNYKNVIDAIRILNDKQGFNLGARSFSISTAGIIDGIKKLSNESLRINLAVSLHAADDSLRLKIMPMVGNYPLLKILKAVDNYIIKTRRKVMFEYVMMKGINDKDKDAEKLAKIMKKPLYFVNLIAYNPTGDFKASSSSRIKEFKEILEKAGVKVGQRYSFGQDIKAACGQLISE
ncbi:MAG TPA: 23S rRNA (adenine(2503)-C(2))-methyltransferase RlmN [bacterium]|nr:23S rRNA (adenine(2503)-C(2))-methyltransferase RlmN [bacterium]